MTNAYRICRHSADLILSRNRYPDDSFDLAWSLESGEHIPDKEAWLAEVYRVLKPGGTFVCVTWCALVISRSCHLSSSM